MSCFTDATGREWSLSFDAFALDDVRRKLSLDFADLGAGAYEQIESNEITLVRVLCLLLADQLSDRGSDARSLSKSLRGDSLDSARAALLEAAADFFPRKKWCGLQSNLARRRTMAAQMAEFRAAVEAMPDGMREGAEQTLMEILRESIATSASEKSPGNAFAHDQDSTPSKPATDLPDSVEQPPEE